VRLPAFDAEGVDSAFQIAGTSRARPVPARLTSHEVNLSVHLELLIFRSLIKEEQRSQ